MNRVRFENLKRLLSTLVDYQILKTTNLELARDLLLCPFRTRDDRCLVSNEGSGGVTAEGIPH